MIQMKSEDIELVRNAQGGDQKAFAGLINSYTRLVNVIIFHHTHRQEETRDLVQEVFLKALENIHQLDEPDKFRSWLIQIARTTSRNWITRRHNMESIEDVDINDPKYLAIRGCDETASDKVGLREIAGIVVGALDSINARYKDVILLKYMEDMTYDEMSEMLNVSVATIRSRLYRAKSKLQEILRIRIPTYAESMLEDSMSMVGEPGQI